MNARLLHGVRLERRKRCETGATNDGQRRPSRTRRRGYAGGARNRRRARARRTLQQRTRTRDEAFASRRPRPTARIRLRAVLLAKNLSSGRVRRVEPAGIAPGARHRRRTCPGSPSRVSAPASRPSRGRGRGRGRSPSSAGVDWHKTLAGKTVATAVARPTPERPARDATRRAKFAIAATGTHHLG